MAARFHRPLAGTTRLEHGLIIILPGIEGCSSINDSIARGLVAGQLSHAIRIIDWRRFRPWNPLHLAMERHNRTQARVVAGVITDYQRNFPGQPVHLIGHSAGAGMALFALEQLPAGHSVTSVTLMAAAVSRKFDVCKQQLETQMRLRSHRWPCCRIINVKGLEANSCLLDLSPAEQLATALRLFLGIQTSIDGSAFRRSWLCH